MEGKNLAKKQFGPKQSFQNVGPRRGAPRASLIIGSLGASVTIIISEIAPIARIAVAAVVPVTPAGPIVEIAISIIWIRTIIVSAMAATITSGAQYSSGGNVSPPIAIMRLGVSCRNYREREGCT